MLKVSKWLLLSVIIIGLDQWTKYLAVEHLAYQTPVYINQFFNLFLDHNTGSAFSFLKSQGGWQIWILGLIALTVSIGIIIYLFKHPELYFLNALGLSLVLGGAIGNLIDRIHYQYVIDFISWHVSQHYWPTFNIADSAVCVGVVFLFLGMKK